MNNAFRGGNSRQLARQLDMITKPIAVIDRKGQIVFVNAALCEMAKADATQLVGKQTSWEIPPDSTPNHALLAALAIPSKAREGRMAIRQFTAPIVFGSRATGQLFIPICGEGQVVQLTLVLFGDYREFQSYSGASNLTDSQSEAELVVMEIRRRWKNLDGLHELLGLSPSIRLAMQRTQLAARSEANFLVHGAPQTGKSAIAKAIFLQRLDQAGLSRAGGQFFSLDCQVLHGSLLDSMLEIFVGRLRPELPPSAQCLVFERLGQLKEETLAVVLEWMDGPLSSGCTLCGISGEDPRRLAEQSPAWNSMISRLAVTEIEVPALVNRREDIGPLACNLLAQQCDDLGCEPMSFSTDALDLLTAFDWPRNVSQLRQVIAEAAIKVGTASELDVAHLPLEIRTFVNSRISAAEAGEANDTDLTQLQPIDLDQVLQDLERLIMRRAIKLSPRNRSQVARWLGISRPRLLRRLRQFGLDEQEISDETDSEGSYSD